MRHLKLGRLRGRAWLTRILRAPQFIMMVETLVMGGFGTWNAPRTATNQALGAHRGSRRAAPRLSHLHRATYAGS